MSGLFTMSSQEVERITVIKQIAEKQLKQNAGAKLLQLTTRQIRRLLKAYARSGVEGLLSKQRGQPGNRRVKNDVKTQAQDLVQKHYHDFGPTFAAEKLKERHQIDVSKETLRQWMMQWELWKAKRKKKAVVHQSRERRACFGELIQIDGSPHDWFEGRAPKCCLLVFIDDATSRLVGMRFIEQETTAGYFTVARMYIEKYGRPLAFYSDKYGVFRVNHKNCEDKETQFGRAMRELNIELICANSPQAKGRVERSNQTLQDRLVKEMRLREISSMEAGNAYLPEFMKNHNAQFAVDPRSATDAHRIELPDVKTLNLIFSFQENRTLSKNLEMNYNNVTYKIQTASQGYGLRHAKIKVCEDLSGVVILVYKGRVLTYTGLKKQKRTPAIVSAKELDDKIVAIRKYAPAPANHPWKKWHITPKKAAS